MVTIGYSALGVSLPLFVAHKTGLFADQGLRVEMKGYPTAHPLVEAVIDNAVPCGGFVAFPISMHRHVRARPLYYACAVAEDLENPISFLLVRRGTTIRSIEDLAGRRVGVLPTRAYREWLKVLLARAGLGYHPVVTDKTCRCTETCGTSKLPEALLVHTYDVLPYETAAALRSGRVDAVFTNDPGVTDAVRSGAAEIFGEQPILPALLGSPFLFGSFVLDSEFVAERPDDARKIVTALDEGVRACQRDPAEVRRLSASYLPRSCADLRDGLGKPVFLTSQEVDSARLQATLDMMAEEKILSRRVAVAPWVLRGDSSLPPACTTSRIARRVPSDHEEYRGNCR